MLFEIENNALQPVRSKWRPQELALEKYIVSAAEEGAMKLNYDVFGEDLLLIRNQVRTRSHKRADILALDRRGNGVIIELKRDLGYLGVEMQALQYLADFSKLRGESFIDHFAKSSDELKTHIKAHCDGDVELDDINRTSRIILIAREFDRTLYSMGEWLTNHGVPFRCIAYTPVEIGQHKFVSFSTAFDQSTELLYPVDFRSSVRDPGYFWHNIADNNESWWRSLVERGEIPACFEESPGDKGERLLKGYIKGDTIVAYARGYGAVGWGIIESPKYRLLKPGEPGDDLGGTCLHRLKIKWRATARKLSDGISPDVVRNDFGIYHPLATSASIDSEKARRLIDVLSTRLAVSNE